MARLVCVWLLFIAYAAFAFYIAAIVPPKPTTSVIAPLCKDPYPAQTGLAWDYCDLIDRYYEI